MDKTETRKELQRIPFKDRLEKAKINLKDVNFAYNTYIEDSARGAATKNTSRESFRNQAINLGTIAELILNVIEILEESCAIAQGKAAALEEATGNGMLEIQDGRGATVLHVPLTTSPTLGTPKGNPIKTAVADGKEK